MARDVRVAILGDSRDFQRAVQQANRSAGILGNTAGKMSGRVKTALAGAGFAAVAFGKQAITQASDLNESWSKMNTVFGESSKQVQQFAKSADAFGLSDQAAADALGTFGNLFDQLNVGSKQSADMSQAMVKLAADLGSFHNADITDVIAAQTSAFRGEYDALQRFVPTINAATVEQKALAITGKRTTKELTAQDKALAVQRLMMEGAGKAAGDFARTSGGLANQQRILSAKFADLQAKVGTALVPAMTKLVGAGLAVLSFMTSLPGPAKAVLAAVAGLAAAAWVLVKAVKAWTAVQAALNVVLTANPIGLIIAGVVALGVAVVVAYKKSETFRNAVDAVGRFLRDRLLPALSAVAGFITKRVVPAFQTIWSFLSGRVIPIVVSVIGTWVRFQMTIANVVATVVARVGGLVAAFVRAFDRVRSAVTGVVAGVVGGFSKMIGYLGSLPARVGAFASRMWNALKNGLSAAITWIRTQIDRLLGPLDEVAGKVGGLLDKIGGGIGSALSGAQSIGSMLGFDTGGTVPGPIGKPRLAVVHGGETVLPTHRQPNMLRAAAPVGNTYHIDVKVAATADPAAVGRELVEAIHAYERINSTSWRN